MKGIILSAGKGTRLYPITVSTPKPLLPVYDKPMLYYPLDILLKAGIKDILIIIPPGDEDEFRSYFGDGSSLGIKLSYKVQEVARGIADAFILGEEFIGDDDVCLILGDNIFYGYSLQNALENISLKENGALCFGLYAQDPRPFGVLEFDKDGVAVGIEEKPQKPKSNYIIPGIYFYSSNVVDIAKRIEPSLRGELEITSVNNEYLKLRKLDVIKLDRDILWYDTGTPENMLLCSQSISLLQRYSNKLIGCVEETAYDMGFITKEQMRELGEKISQSEYGKYLLGL